VGTNGEEFRAAENHCPQAGICAAVPASESFINQTNEFPSDVQARKDRARSRGSHLSSSNDLWIDGAISAATEYNFKIKLQIEKFLFKLLR